MIEICEKHIQAALDYLDVLDIRHLAAQDPELARRRMASMVDKEVTLANFDPLIGAMLVMIVRCSNRWGMEFIKLGSTPEATCPACYAKHRHDTECDHTGGRCPDDFGDWFVMDACTMQKDVYDRLLAEETEPAPDIV